MVDDMRRVHGAHTIVLYGSHARGDATPESDIDLAVFADVDAPLQDARPWQATLLDAFVYPSARAAPTVDLLRLCEGVILLDERGLATPLLDALAALHKQGPPPIADAGARRVWAKKMSMRARRGDVEADYRRHWLLFQLLEDHFAFRGVWYPGPKRALAALQVQSPSTYAAFARALAPTASIDDLDALVDIVTAEAAVPPPS
jgi:hypothetical protein